MFYEILVEENNKTGEGRQFELEIWPGRERFERLCVRAAGLFTWAVTDTRFFEEQVRLHEPECLDVLLDAITAEAVEDVYKSSNIILAVRYRSSHRLSETLDMVAYGSVDKIV